MKQKRYTVNDNPNPKYESELSQQELLDLLRKVFELQEGESLIEAAESAVDDARLLRGLTRIEKTDQGELYKLDGFGICLYEGASEIVFQRDDYSFGYLAEEAAEYAEGLQLRTALINNWRESGSTLEVHDFLGVSRGEYDVWLEDATEIPEKYKQLATE